MARKRSFLIKKHFYPFKLCQIPELKVSDPYVIYLVGKEFQNRAWTIWA